MSRAVKEIEKAITLLPLDQLSHFRAWYDEFDSERWDEQISIDVAAGKLDDLATSAIAAHKMEKSKKI